MKKANLGILFISLLLSCVSMAETSPAVLQERIEKQNQKQELVLSGLMSINRKVKALVLEKGKIQREVDSLNASIDSLEAEVKATQESMHLQRIQLSKRMRAMGHIASGGWAQFFFSRQSAPDFERNLRILKIVSQRDQQLIQGYQIDAKALKNKQEKLRARKLKSIEKQNAVSKQEAALLAEISKKNQILAKIKKSKAFSLKQVQQVKLRMQHLNLEDSGVLDNLLRPSFADQKGLLSSPLQTISVLREFGVMKTQNYVIKNRGVFLQAELGEKVKTVSEGKVVLSDLIPGKGQTIIIDHGDHYYSVYSNLDQSLVRVGQSVAGGDVIGQTGYSLLSETTGLYFELRHFSEAYDPGQWVKGLKL